jgi:hypothetical protein
MSQADRNRSHPLDEQIRRALEPDSGAVQRVVSGALAAEPGRRRLHRFRLLVTVPVLVLVIGAALALLQRRQTAVPADPDPVVIVVKTEQPPVYRISNIGDVITITKPNGQVQAIVSGGTSS